MSGALKVTLAPVPGFRAEGADAINAGSWCADPDCTPDHTPTHPHPFLDIATWRAGYDFGAKAYAQAMSALSAAIDAYHGTDCGHAYWEHVLGWFVRVQTDVAIAGAQLLRDIAAQHPGATFIGLDPDQNERPLDTKNFAEAIRRSHLANLQVLTQIARHLDLPLELRRLGPGLAGGGLSKVFSTDGLAGVDAPRVDPPRALKATVLFYKSLLRKRTEVPLRASSFGRIRVLGEITAGVASGLVDDDLRRALAKAPCDTDLGALVLALVAQNLPTALLEDWPARSSVLERFTPYPKVIVTGLGSFWSSDFAIWSAAARAQGTRFIGLQHGGTYGERDSCVFETHERHLSDAYVTWGWSEDQKTVPLPAPRLSGIPRRRKPVPDGPILWVGTADSPYVYQMGPRPVGPQFMGYFQSQRAFAATLDARVRPQVLFRPYPSAFGWPNQPGVVGDPMDVTQDDLSRSFHQRMAEARLVVVDHPGSTTMLEALSADIPVMCFGSPEHFDIRPSARVHYETLTAQGLYHPSATDAARALGDIAGDVPAWWATPERQAAAQSFAADFARRGRFLGDWCRFLSAQGRF